MAPNKFEKQLKETLERRTIAPSSNAWSQLYSKLDAEEKKRKFPFWWLGIAATFVGVFFAISIFNTEEKPTESIVNETKNEIIDVKDITPIKKKELIVEEQPVQNKIQTLPTTKNKQANPAISNKKAAITKNNTNTAQQDIASATIIKNEELPIKNIQLIDETNQSNAIVEVVKENLATDEVSDLLEAAFAEVNTTNTNNSIENIDANSLLEEVEIESEVSLKNRLFQVVKSGFETVKTAVVERDY